MSSAVVRTVALSKRYRGGVLALDRAELRIEQGEIYGFLGLNGAGKTAAIRLLLGMLSPTAGHAELFGQRVRAEAVSLWRRVGHLVENATAYPGLTVARTWKWRDGFTASATGARWAAPLRSSSSASMQTGRRGRSPLATSSGSRWPAPCSTTRNC